MEITMYKRIHYIYKFRHSRFRSSSVHGFTNCKCRLAVTLKYLRDIAEISYVRRI